MNLLIVSDMPHFRTEAGQIVGWGPTVEEINCLAQRFEKITHIGFLYDGMPSGNMLPYKSVKINFVSLQPAGGNSLYNKVGILVQAPSYLNTIFKHLGSADVVHVRCPSNVGLLLVILLAFLKRPKFRWIKYAGNWQPRGSEPLSYTLHRWLLQHDLPRAMVTVNGRWPEQPTHIYSFDNPSLYEGDIVEGRQIAVGKKLCLPLQLLFVGGLERGKGVFETLEIASRLWFANFDFNLEMVGDGSERSALESVVRRTGLESRVRFHGWIPKPQLARFYGQAHLLILPSRSEGWPKVLSEGMAYGVVPLAGAVSSIPQILQECETGTSLNPTDVQAFIQAILAYTHDPARWKRESLAASQAASRFTYEAYINHLKTVFANCWGLAL